MWFSSTSWLKPEIMHTIIDVVLAVIPSFISYCHRQHAVYNTQFLLLLSYTVCSQKYPVSSIAVIHCMLSIIPNFFNCSHTQCAVSNTPHRVTLIDSVFSIIPSFIGYSHSMLSIIPSSISYPPRHCAVCSTQCHQLFLYKGCCL